MNLHPSNGCTVFFPVFFHRSRTSRICECESHKMKPTDKRRITQYSIRPPQQSSVSLTCRLLQFGQNKRNPKSCRAGNFSTSTSIYGRFSVFSSSCGSYCNKSCYIMHTWHTIHYSERERRTYIIDFFNSLMDAILSDSLTQ
jgi:hypothetical protein